VSPFKDWKRRRNQTQGSLEQNALGHGEGKWSDWVAIAWVALRLRVLQALQRNCQAQRISTRRNAILKNSIH